MNHAERVKEFIKQFLAYQIGKAEMDAAIDEMQSALDDAVTKRDEYMGLWAALSQDEGKAERAIAELETKLAARDAEVERLRKDTHALILECQVAFAEELAAWDIDPPLHHVKQAHDKCTAWINAALSEEVKGGE